MLFDLWAKISPEPNSGCWLWDAGGNGNGYGRFRYAGRQRYAHRVVYELLVGPIPDGLQIDHLCRVRCCVNPQHMQPVTQQENIRRGLAGAHEAVKTHCPHGHAYTLGNTYVNPRGSRECRTCRLARR